MLSSSSRGATAATGPRRRVLVFRSCRMPQFRSALAQVRRLHPSADVWALTHEDFSDQVLAAGVDQVVTHRATRLSAARLGLRLLMRLRRLDFDAVVIPLMSAQLGPASNLMRLAACVGAPTVSLHVGGAPMRTHPLRTFRRLAVAATLNCRDIVILGQMLRAAVQHRLAEEPRLTGAPMRVLHIINSLGVGGAQTQCAELVNCTPRGQFDIDVLVLANDSDFSLSRLRRSDVSIAYLGESDWHSGTIVDSIAEHCRRGRYDVVHTWLPIANMVGTAAARLAGVPRILASVRSVNPGNFPQWRQWWHRIGDVLAARIADVVTVNAQPLVKDHAGWALMDPRRVQVVHNGIDPSSIQEDLAAARTWLRESLAIAADTPLIGCVGRLAIEKDQATFVRALALLRDARVRFHAVLVGDGACEAALRALVVDLGLVDCISFLGARTDARRIMAGLDVLALTSRFEGFPNVLLEAGLLGVPIVSTDAGGVSDVLDDAEGLCPCGDAHAVAKALSSTIRHPERTAARAVRLKARCHEHFTADRMVANWMALYQHGAARE